MKGIACLALVLSLLIISKVSADGGHFPGNKLAVICGKKIYTCRFNSPRDKYIAINFCETDNAQMIHEYYLSIDEVYESFGNRNIDPCLYPPCWDIAGGSFWTIILCNFTGQETFALVEIPLRKIKELKNNSTQDNLEGKLLDTLLYRIVSPEKGISLKEGISILPLDSSNTLTDKTKNPMYYNFNILGENSFEIYILLNDEIRIWKFDKGEWSKTAAFKASFKGPFVARRIKDEIFFLNHQGKLFATDGLASKDGKVKVKPVEEIKKEKIKLAIIDKDSKNVFWVSSEKIFDSSRPPVVREISKKELKKADADSPMKNITKYLPVILKFKAKKGADSSSANYCNNELKIISAANSKIVNGLQMGINILSKRKFIEEPTYLNLNIINMSKQKKEIGITHCYRDFDLEVFFGDNQNVVPKTKFGKKHLKRDNKPISLQLVKLDPGKKFQYTVCLSRLFDLTISGTYSLTVTYCHKTGIQNGDKLSVEKLSFDLTEERPRSNAKKSKEK